MNEIRVLSPVLTRVGTEAIFNAEANGLKAKVAHIALGTASYSPDGFETTLREEVIRLPVLGGQKVDPHTAEMVALLDNGPLFDVSEVGVVLDDGTLLAVWSDPQTPLARYTPGVPIAISYALSIHQLPADSIELTGDLDLTLFFVESFAVQAAGVIGNFRRTLKNQFNEARARNFRGA